MKGPFASLTAFITGLLIVQIIATVQVYASNNALYASLDLLRGEGYLLVPNELVMEKLKRLGPAFFGGLFFTLTLGAGLSFAGLSFAWIWDRLFRRKKVILWLSILFWCTGIAAVNKDGVSFFGTLYFAVTPPAVFCLALSGMDKRKEKGFPWKEMVPLLPVFILAALWLPRMEGKIFTEIRDNLLLSSPWGIECAEGYYRYTLYPAYVCKPLDQRQLKTCRIEGFKNRNILLSLEKKLIYHDYLPVSKSVRPVDLAVSPEGENCLLFDHQGKTIFRFPLDAFMADSGKILKTVSDRLDRNKFFRAAIYFSLCLASPLMLYFFLFACVRGFLRLHSGVHFATITASVICLVIGLLLLNLSTNRSLSGNTIGSLASSAVEERIRALRHIEMKEEPVERYEGYRLLAKSPHSAERYWLVRTLALSRSPETYGVLLSLLDDPSPVVQYSAYDALKRRAGTGTAGEIEKRIPHVMHWYSQLYAYKALRELGWVQQLPPEH
jgi:hypothetical protein